LAFLREEFETKSEAKGGENVGGFEELRGRIKKTTRKGIEKLPLEIKGIVRVTRLRSEVRRKKNEMEKFLTELGKKTYQLHLKKKIGHAQLKKLGSKITQLKKDIETKKKDIQRLRER